MKDFLDLFSEDVDVYRETLEVVPKVRELLAALQSESYANQVAIAGQVLCTLMESPELRAHELLVIREQLEKAAERATTASYDRIMSGETERNLQELIERGEQRLESAVRLLGGNDGESN